MLFALTIMVGIHEAGHMLFAKLFGMRVEQFFIGFKPKLFSRKIGDTEYGFGILPLGGFVKITGMIDESLDTESLKSEPQPYEFRAKPAWQRLLVMLGGIMFNVATGVIFSIMVLFVWGREFVEYKEMDRLGIVPGAVGQEIGLKEGDVIININGQPYERLSSLTNPDMLLEGGNYYTVRRDGEEIKVSLPDDILDRLSKNNGGFFTLRTPFEVGEVMPKFPDGSPTPASIADLQKGDRIISMEDTAVHYFHEFADRLTHYTNQEVRLTVMRDGQEKELTCPIGEKPKIGFYVEQRVNSVHEEYPIGEALAHGTADAFGVLNTQGKAFGKMATGGLSVTESLSGPLGILFFFPPEWNWQILWTWIAKLSMVLAFMNLLPIPALDGGHVMFLLYEIISGRKPSTQFLTVAQYAGMIFLLGLIIFVFGLDIWKNFIR